MENISFEAVCCDWSAWFSLVRLSASFANSAVKGSCTEDRIRVHPSPSGVYLSSSGASGREEAFQQLSRRSRKFGPLEIAAEVLVATGVVNQRPTLPVA